MLDYFVGHPEGLTRGQLHDRFPGQTFSIETIVNSLRKAGQLKLLLDARLQLTVDKWAEVAAS
jgi:hypothetical protein